MRPRVEATTSFALVSLMSNAATRAPAATNCSTMDLPIPEAAPVTTTTLSSSDFDMVVPFYWESCGGVAVRTSASPGFIWHSRQSGRSGLPMVLSIS